MSVDICKLSQFMANEPLSRKGVRDTVCMAHYVHAANNSITFEDLRAQSAKAALLHIEKGPQVNN